MFNSVELSKIILGVALRTMINFLMVLGLIEALVYSYHFSYKLFADIPYRPAQVQSVSVTIPEGSNAVDVAKLIDGFELVDGEYMLLARMYLGRYNEKIMAGTYSLSPSMSPDQICRCICGMNSEDES